MKLQVPAGGTPGQLGQRGHQGGGAQRPSRLVADPQRERGAVPERHDLAVGRLAGPLDELVPPRPGMPQAAGQEASLLRVERVAASGDLGRQLAAQPGQVDHRHPVDQVGGAGDAGRVAGPVELQPDVADQRDRPAGGQVAVQPRLGEPAAAGRVLGDRERLQRPLVSRSFAVGIGVDRRGRGRALVVGEQRGDRGPVTLQGAAQRRDWQGPHRPLTADTRSFIGGRHCSGSATTPALHTHIRRPYREDPSAISLRGRRIPRRPAETAIAGSGGAQAGSPR